VGVDNAAADWLFQDEQQLALQLNVLEPEAVRFLEALNYSDYCALTDLDIRLKARHGWHPSYLTAFDPRDKQTRVVLFRPGQDCQMVTDVSMTVDKQRLICDGGKKTACGQRNLPLRGQASATVFLKSVNFDPVGQDHWRCEQSDVFNAYTFKGSYYHAYVKLASCDMSQGKNNCRILS